MIATLFRSSIEADAWWNRAALVAPFGECQCGCGERTLTATKSHREKGWVTGMPRKYRKGHHTRLSGETIVRDANGCWVWQLGLAKDGYGSKWTPSGSVVAHRWYFEQTYGPIEEGLTLDHLCQNRACVNPDHMEPVTLRENISRRGQEPQFQGGEG